jgi:hypothetical protein
LLCLLDQIHLVSYQTVTCNITGICSLCSVI